MEKLKKVLELKGISIYKLSQLTGVKYELLRRTFNESRKLTADELVLILNKTGIEFSEIK